MASVCLMSRCSSRLQYPLKFRWFYPAEIKPDWIWPRALVVYPEVRPVADWIRLELARGTYERIELDAVDRRWVEELGGMNLYFVYGDKIITQAHKRSAQRRYANASFGFFGDRA